MPFKKHGLDDYVDAAGQHFTAPQVKAAYAEELSGTPEPRRTQLCDYKMQQLDEDADVDEAAMDDGSGRGDVAPPAGGMPRSLEDVEPMTDDEANAALADLAAIVHSAAHPPNPRKVKSPKGSAPAPGKAIGHFGGGPAAPAAAAAAAPAAMAEDRRASVDPVRPFDEELETALADYDASKTK